MPSLRNNLTWSTFNASVSVLVNIGLEATKYREGSLGTWIIINNAGLWSVNYSKNTFKQGVSLQPKICSNYIERGPMTYKQIK